METVRRRIKELQAEGNKAGAEQLMQHHRAKCLAARKVAEQERDRYKGQTEAAEVRIVSSQKEIKKAAGYIEKSERKIKSMNEELRFLKELG